MKTSLERMNRPCECCYWKSEKPLPCDCASTWGHPSKGDRAYAVLHQWISEEYTDEELNEIPCRYHLTHKEYFDLLRELFEEKI